MRRWTTVLAIGLVLWTAPASAQRGTPPSRRSLGELSAEVARTTQAYRDAVARSIPQHEASVREALAALEEGRRLHKAGALPATYVEQAERDLAAAERELEEAQQALDDADRLLFEAALQQRLAATNISDPSPPGAVTFLLGTHPPAMDRIGAALAYEQER